MPPRQATSIASDEIDRFSRHADDWWNPEGKFRPLHRLNPVRMEYIRDQACAHFGRDSTSRTSLKGLDILDVGCGGGLLAEPMARLGGRVTGLDASPEALKIARQHGASMRLDIDYVSGGVEDLVRNPKRYDLITALEIVEHVADLGSFIRSLVKLVKPGGLLIMSTLNRTPKSFLLGIIAAEYILGWVPRGTHQWQKFIRPSELVRRLEEQNLKIANLKGLVFNPLRGAFELRAGDLGVNYLLTAQKAKAGS